MDITLQTTIKMVKRHGNDVHGKYSEESIRNGWDEKDFHKSGPPSDRHFYGMVQPNNYEGHKGLHGYEWERLERPSWYCFLPIKYDSQYSNWLYALSSSVRMWGIIFDVEAGRRMASEKLPQTQDYLARRLRQLNRHPNKRGWFELQRSETVQQNGTGAKLCRRGPSHGIHPTPSHVKGRKLQTPWLGQYQIEEVLTKIAYIVRGEINGNTIRVHANRLWYIGK